MLEEEFQKLRIYALKLLSFRPRTIKEIRTRLVQFSIKRRIDAELVDKLLEDLISHGLVDDREFVNWWIEQRDSFRPKGKKALQMELRSKGIATEIIEEVLNLKKSDEEEFFLAQKVISKKMSLYRSLSTEKMKIKVSSLLLRRGFSWEIIYKVIDSILKKS